MSSTICPAAPSQLTGCSKPRCWVPEHDPKNDKLTSAWSTLQNSEVVQTAQPKSETTSEETRRTPENDQTRIFASNRMVFFDYNKSNFCADSRTKSALNEMLTTSCFPSQNTLNTKSLDHNCFEFYGADSDSKKDSKFFEIRVLGINLYLIFKGACT